MSIPAPKFDFDPLGSDERAEAKSEYQNALFDCRLGVLEDHPEIPFDRASFYDSVQNQFQEAAMNQSGFSIHFPAKANLKGSSLAELLPEGAEGAIFYLKISQGPFLLPENHGIVHYDPEVGWMFENGEPVKLAPYIHIENIVLPESIEVFAVPPDERIREVSANPAYERIANETLATAQVGAAELTDPYLSELEQGLVRLQQLFSKTETTESSLKIFQFRCADMLQEATLRMFHYMSGEEWWNRVRMKQGERFVASRKHLEEIRRAIRGDQGSFRANFGFLKQEWKPAEGPSKSCAQIMREAATKHSISPELIFRCAVVESFLDFDAFSSSGCSGAFSISSYYYKKQNSKYLRKRYPPICPLNFPNACDRCAQILSENSKIIGTDDLDMNLTAYNAGAVTVRNAFVFEKNLENMGTAVKTELIPRKYGDYRDLIVAQYRRSLRSEENPYGIVLKKGLPIFNQEASGHAERAKKRIQELESRVPDWRKLLATA